ncbi:UDP-glucose/GDP-mannose dehydrogenase family protein [Pseudomonas sp. RP23018S]|uniref:UDP-glucose dehydrogenase family protein n=1 Tax=Pseudomonas sp. RP23018S TaxID=3096037 RepID=UPI002ACAF9D2|nr:UDP-glucose/GDP-mannose dehydrogenase family protein [Pseudomonas sp. RP23018S]MDZ5602693.1 UDP-glucose/GDP-mannose dehydrogenase family protein [Pseudomonas sp. RP23018S]
MDVSVFGSGYVGLVQAVALADVGHRVLCVDVDTHKISQLSQGVPPISEPGLSELLEDNLQAGRLSFSTQASDAVAHAELLFIAVGTPPDEDGSADLSHVLEVTRQIAALMTSNRTVIIKSTVPVGTADQVKALALDELRRLGKGELSVSVVSNPEFLKEGSALADCMRPDRIIVGSDDDRAGDLLGELYAPFSRSREKLMFMDNRSAELTKYAANAMLATRISFMNELANLSERLGADIEAVRRGIGSDPRIGYHFIYPGCGFGGSCFPKDIRALLHSATQSGMPLQLLQSVSDVNDQQRRLLFAKLARHLGKPLEGASIAVWGLAFKPNTDDMREAPSRYLIEALWAEGANVRAYDPQAMDECRRLYGYRADLHLCATRDDTLQDADALVICTEWKHFRVIDFALLASKLRSRLVIDGRNLYDPEQMAAHGLRYSGIGLRHVAPVNAS